VGKLENYLDAFIGRILNETAGVDNDNIGLVRIFHNGPAGPFYAAQHDFAVHKISGASETQ
jgi:hypothetical protein